MRLSLVRTSLAVCILAAGGSHTFAQDPAARCPCLWHRLHRAGTPTPHKPRFIPHTDERAGNPRWLARHVQPSETAGGIGYFVGGGVALGHGHGRDAAQGTWGWDETGSTHFRRRVNMGWSQGRKYQGGTGAYRTDGHVPPDVVYAATSVVNSLGRPPEDDR